MADTFTKRMLGNERERHIQKIRSAVEDVQLAATRILADLDADRVPTYHLVNEAVEIERRIWALQAINDVTGIYDAQDQAEAQSRATSTTPPPTHPYAGSNSERQSVGLPGHCERCAQVGHVKAHPDLGCGDVGCTAFHPDED